MAHIETVQAFIGKAVQIYDGRIVRVTGYGPTGSASCEAADGKEPIYSISTAFLTPANVR